MRRDRHVHRWASTSPGTGICLMVHWGTEALPECLCSRPVHRRAPLVSLPLHILIFVMSTPDLCLLPGLVDLDCPGPDPVLITLLLRGVHHALFWAEWLVIFQACLKYEYSGQNIVTECGGLCQVTLGKTWNLLWSNHIFIYDILRCQNLSLSLQWRLSNAAFIGGKSSFQLSLSLKSPPYLCECAGRNSKYGCAILEKLCEAGAGTVTGTGDGLVVASPTDAVWFPKQVKYIHSGLCFLDGTNREVYLTLCFTVMIEWSIITLMFLNRVCVTCFVHRIV